MYSISKKKEFMSLEENKKRPEKIPHVSLISEILNYLQKHEYVRGVCMHIYIYDIKTYVCNQFHPFFYNAKK